MVFSKPIAAADINSLTGLTTSAFSGLGTTTLTWTITPVPLGAFSTSLLATGPDAIKDASGNPLAGGTPFNQALKVLWGDLNDDGVVTAVDLGLDNAARSLSYNIFADADGNGIIDANDVNVVRSRLGTSQP